MNFKTFSQREREKRGIVAHPETTKFSPHLRQQIILILKETFGCYYDNENVGIGNDLVETTKLWKDYERLIQREVPSYSPSFGNKRYLRDARSRICEYINVGMDAAVIDVLDIGVTLLHRDVRAWQAQDHSTALQDHDSYLEYCKVSMSVDEALYELDLRLRQAGTIYRVDDGIIIKSTDDYSHTEMILPALRALGGNGFENALQEFHDALVFSRNGVYSDAMHKANLAFESTMKVISGAMEWPYEKAASAKAMLKVMRENKLFPAMLESSANALITLMESTLPTLRNKTPSVGHGAGEQSPVIDEAIATFAINSAASYIRMLVELYWKMAGRLK